MNTRRWCCGASLADTYVQPAPALTALRSTKRVLLIVLQIRRPAQPQARVKRGYYIQRS